MKIFISDTIRDELSAAPDGTVVYGTISREFDVASVTSIDPSGQDDSIRTALAVLGGESHETPFDVVHGDKQVWTDRNGETVTVEIYSGNDFYRRTPFDPLMLNHLQDKTIMIIGLGSVGASMGRELAKSGVGKIIGVDKDIFEIHNCMRHVLGTEYIGWPKPEAFSHYLKEQVPGIKCVPVFGNIFEGNREALQKLIEEEQPTQILAVTDSLHIQYLCQMTAIQYQLPMMAVACDSNAVEGEIFFWEPGQAETWKPGRPERGCYACMRDPDAVTIERSSHFDYSSDDPDSYGGEPALGTFINRINNIATIFMTAWLLKDSPVKGMLSGILDTYYEGLGLQYIRLGGPYPFSAEGRITAREPWSVEWYRVLKREECPFCRDTVDLEKLLFSAEEPDEAGIADDFDRFGSAPEENVTLQEPDRVMVSLEND